MIWISSAWPCPIKKAALSKVSVAGHPYEDFRHRHVRYGFLQLACQVDVAESRGIRLVPHQFWSTSPSCEEHSPWQTPDENRESHKGSKTAYACGLPDSPRGCQHTFGFS